MSRTLFDALQELPDRRGRKGRQMPLPAILALAVAAMLAGADSLIAYYVTSRAPHEADAGRLLALARAHWGIENKLHWRRDVSMNEDRCRVRAGARPFASLRNLALTLLRGSGLSVPAAREAYAADWSAALHAVTGRIL